jgi:arylsulfatase A-like enzyme
VNRKVGAIRQGKWKYKVKIKKGRSDSPVIAGVELYDVVKDPAEERNLQSKHPKLVERLGKRLLMYKSKAADEIYVPDPDQKKGKKKRHHKE